MIAKNYGAKLQRKGKSGRKVFSNGKKNYVMVGTLLR